jgi:hypothetical protein
MKSSAPGENISEVEVTNISGHGIWLYVRGTEHFLSYEDFPWFRDQSVRAISHVEEPSTGHFFWPEIDVDLSEEIIRRPDRYPLAAR